MRGLGSVEMSGSKTETMTGITVELFASLPPLDPFFPGATQVSANGQRDANQRVTLDGVIASDPLVNTVYLNPSIDAIEEIKIQTGSYSAEYGMNNGAIVQVALKSGSNDFHGSFQE